MQNIHLVRRLWPQAVLVVTLFFAVPSTLWAQGVLEIPRAGSYQSGIGGVFGWYCDAGTITVSFDDGPPIEAAYGTPRADTQTVCGDRNNAFGLPWNWNLLGEGLHTVQVFADGVAFASATFRVTTLGAEFLRGVAGTCTVGNFPEEGTSATVRWDESLQNFAVIAESSGGGFVETFTNPPEIVSVNGVLETTFTAAMAEVAVADQQVLTVVYNGLYVPPTLRARPGDTIKLRLVNGFNQLTNLHYHGMNVSPLGNSDNIFLMVMPNDPPFEYEIQIPDNHPSGLFYYHSHAHGFTEYQIFSGLSGGLIVEGLLDPFPALQGITERVMMLKDIQIVGESEGMGTIPPPGMIDSNAGTTRTINGLVNPTVKIRPGETQLWRVGNIGADIYYRLKLDGHTLYEIARDGNRLTQIIPQEEILLPTSSRVEFLVQGGPQGLYRFRTLPIDMGPPADKYPEATLATLVSDGPSEPLIPLPTNFPLVEDLRNRPIANRRTFVFSVAENPDGSFSFLINGQTFDMDRIDTTVRLGDVEEWTIVNASEGFHVFHIHQLDFQVTEVNGEAQPFVGHQDTVNLPIQTDTGPGEVKILVPFTNPVIVGKFVYHCHIAAHEDLGMMAVIEVEE